MAASVNPRSVAALASLATLGEAASNYVEAEILWQRILSLDPRNHHLRRRVASQNQIAPIDRY